MKEFKIIQCVKCGINFEIRHLYKVETGELYKGDCNVCGTYYQIIFPENKEGEMSEQKTIKITVYKGHTKFETEDNTFSIPVGFANIDSQYFEDLLFRLGYKVILKKEEQKNDRQTQEI